ncbi:SH3 domain-containing protein [Flavobacterium granuli]|uniref:SH3 domain-containing protein n=1 Tax=Flavobacterium granuli TaxID=280093 RepID=A0A1M5I409_9FLAO|nr:SH3 domain-containing protein [Flavobacterium granuli]PRZ27773.1 SH3 domain-containing protein [Flavobacterium granuli]SHG22877.1 SH3 domain-containing protein [Flavobacterium granuli]
MKYRVATASLNLRDFPATDHNSKILTQIPFRHTVKLIDKTTTDWWKVKLLNGDKEGFVLSKDIEALDESNIKSTDIEVPNFEPSSKSRLDSKEETYKPISDPSIPFRDLTSLESKLSSIRGIIDALDVSRSFRYEKDAADTYCNIYTFDYCFFAKVYIPRLRWTDKAIEELEKGNEVAVVFGDTVRPFYSNYIYDWFLQSAKEFGWQRIDNVDELQNKVNANGGVGIICAKRFILNKSGHIVVVVPETDTEKAYRKDGKVIYPLQSQAGADNYNYFSEIRKDWWDNKDPEKGYSSAIFYYHE